MKVHFPENVIRELYGEYKKHSDAFNKRGYEPREVLFPLCIDDENIVNLGTKSVIGKPDGVNDIPHHEDVCDKGTRLGSIHTHPYDILADDIDLFEETAKHSMSDYFGLVANMLNYGTEYIVSCAMEPLTKDSMVEDYEVVCKSIKDVSEADLQKVRRTRRPDYNRVKQSKVSPAAQQFFIETAQEWFEDYPFDEPLPQSVIDGMKRDVFEEVAKRTKSEAKNGIVYPPPSVQHSTNIDDWIHQPWPTDPVESHGMRQKVIFFRKADAASIENHFVKAGKAKTDSFHITCKRRPLMRKTRKDIGPRYKTICNFEDKTLNL